MLRVIWNIIKFIVTIWAFLSIAAIILDALGLLPYYDIYYRKKTDITPIVSSYPGQNVRLSADFARSVELKDIERIVWNLKDSSGKKYPNLPQLREVDITLIPDFSGIINVEVKAKIFQENKERYGIGSIHIVQTKPLKLTRLKNGQFMLPSDIGKIDLMSVQLYEGSENWLPAHATVEKSGVVRFTTMGPSFPVWDGKAYFRYKPTSDPSGSYQYKAATALNLISQ